MLRAFCRIGLLVACYFSLPLTFAAQSLPSRGDDIHTYSILGYDPATGDLGIAIASRVFNVSSFNGKAGVGVFSLQHSFLGQNLLTTVDGIRLNGESLSPADAISTPMTKDAGREWRHRRQGGVAGFTGPKRTHWTGDRQDRTSLLRATC